MIGKFDYSRKLMALQGWRKLLVYWLLTINYEMEISDLMIADVAECRLDKVPTLMEGVIKIAKHGAIERIPDWGYIYKTAP